VPRVDPARQVAFELLRAVDERGAYANLTLPALLRDSRLDARDRAFATELGYGTLRMLGTLDHVLGLASDRRIDTLEPAVRDALRLGAYQLLRTRVPPHAAVASTVDLVTAAVGPRATGFANAVLRRVAERAQLPEDEQLAAPAYDADPIAHLAIRYAHPRWIVSAFRDALGGDLAETRAALAADDERPQVHLVARPGPGGISRDDLLAEARDAGLVAEPGPWSPYAVRLAGGDPGTLAAVRSGAAAVQDEGSQLAALALAAAPVAADPDRTWVDLCAGPGGKAALLAGLLPADGRLVAIERQPHRAALVARALGGSRGVAVVADGTRPPLPAAAASRILVDAPCTGLGALRRRPEVRWRRSADDVAPLHALQVGLLDAALAAVRPGGVVAYVTCSPHRHETVDVVDEVLAGRREVRRLDAPAVLPAVPGSCRGLDLQLWPHRHGTDAMFVSLLRSGDGTGAPRS
jgi:16S rRNA (cytosine967-C5)-methyltransferase